MLLHQVGTKEGELDSLLHKRLNAGLSTFCIAQALLLVSNANEDCQQCCNMLSSCISFFHAEQRLMQLALDAGRCILGRVLSCCCVSH